MNRAKSACAD